MKNKILLSTIVILYLIVTIIIVALIIDRNKENNQNDFFSDSKFYTVELKSSNSLDDNSFGTAVFIDDDGTLVSNAHMVTYKKAGMYKEFTKFEIRFSFEDEYRGASLINYDLTLDIALLKIVNSNDINYKKVKIGNDYNISSGDKVYAIGNGMNHGIGISEGIISIPRVNIIYEEIVRTVIQCNLTINEGNSGGALLDDDGRLIGITTFRLKDSSGNIIYGIAFCIPVSIVMNYVSEFK